MEQIRPTKSIEASGKSRLLQTLLAKGETRHQVQVGKAETPKDGKRERCTYERVHIRTRADSGTMVGEREPMSSTARRQSSSRRYYDYLRPHSKRVVSWLSRGCRPEANPSFVGFVFLLLRFSSIRRSPLTDPTVYRNSVPHPPPLFSGFK